MHVVETLDVGGMENGLVNIANFIDHSIFNFRICCFTQKGKLSKRILDAPEVVLELNYGPGLHLESVFRLASLFRKQRVQILHTHGWGARMLVAYLGAKLSGVPFIVNGEHGVLHITKKSQFVVQRFILKHCDAILSVSEGLKTKVIQEFGLDYENISVIQNGVDTEKFHGNYPVEPILEDLCLGQDEFRIGVIGSLKQQKNQRVVLQAVSLLDQQDTDFRLLLIGDGPDRNMLEALKYKLNIENKVLFLGNRDDVHRLMSVLDLLILPSISDHEGMSNVILEAMASNVPVISSTSVGSKELIEDRDNGLLFDYDNATELKEKIVILKRDRNFRMHMTKKAKRKILAHHTIDAMVKNYEKFYMKLLTGR